MPRDTELVKNAAGRLMPTAINGRPAVPFQGVGQYTPAGCKAAPPVRSTNDYPRDGNKAVTYVGGIELGVKDLRWFPSACFPCHAPLMPLLESGAIHHIEGSMKGPFGDFASTGKMNGTGYLRSHGGRRQAVQDGDVHIDIAVLAAPTCDPFGDANGVNGRSACGGLGFGLVDSLYADHVIMVTDNLVHLIAEPSVSQPSAFTERYLAPPTRL
ncbi:MAG: citrate lyase subunit alpha [Planctomycetota bacterium]